MENNTDNVNLKSPKRTKKSIHAHTTPTSKMQPNTPNRTDKVLEFQTPSRSDVMIGSQTPRRSARKSIKPIQEYENIVAQKGLSAKQIASSSIDDEIEEERTETKWEPSVIGRVSSKRGKKSRRDKKKQLQRQKRISEQLEVDVLKNNEESSNKTPPKNLETNVASVIVEEHIKEEEQPVLLIDAHLPEENEHDNPETKTAKVTQTTSPSIQNKANVSESSDEEGDVEMAKMPVTADDMESPTKNFRPSTAYNLPPTEDSDCIMLSLTDSHSADTYEESKSIHDSVENNMPTLLIQSDDEEEVFVDASENPEKVNNIQDQDQNKEHLTIETAEAVDLNGTFDANESSTESTVPKSPLLRPSISRVPTPFKSNKSLVPDIIVETENDLLESELTPEIIMEPRELKLRGSRKRSFSICTDKPKKCVTFHSPANTTVFMFHGDMTENSKNEETNNTNKYRKRSLSVAETEREMMDYIQHKKVQDNTPQKKNLQKSKLKMPNFASIHKKQFQMMESISDHVVRKAERAKILTNSATKIQPASVQKGLPVKNSVLRENNANKKSALPTSKARQRIDLSHIEKKPKTDVNNSLHNGLQFRSKSKQDLSLFDNLPSIDKLPLKSNANTTMFAANTMKPRLPKPCFNSTVSSEVPISTAKNPTSKLKSLIPNKTIASVSNHQSRLQDAKARFNLSTALDKPAPKVVDKLGDRRKRMMEMYKSRNATRTEDKKEILKGVRTNRRFELQMMCRNRPN